MIAGSSLFFPMIHIKSVVLMSLWPRTAKILISSWPRTRKFSHFFKKHRRGRPFLTMVTRWSHSTSNFFTLIGQNLTGEFMRKFMQHLESCLLWQLRLTEFCVNLSCFQLSFSTGCAKWNTAAIKSLLLSMAGLFIGFLVEKCVACQNSVFRFRMASFSFFTLLNA